MRFDNLADWLSWQERLHPNTIDLGLERVVRVLKTLRLEQPPFRILTVGGTNGKGSCVALTEAMLRAAGYRVGAYTSPHLLRYNERVRVDGVEASDQEFCAAFADIDAARGDISLTYFEFGTLAALLVFARRGIDVAVLEVGLGGRLDAVNAVDADASLVASVGIDHVDWLGPDRESIGFEKAGIYRRDRPALCGDRSPPASLMRHAGDIGAQLTLLGRDFDHQMRDEAWEWRAGADVIADLPPPALPGRVQFDNAATVIAALRAMAPVLPVPTAALREGLRKVRLLGRFQRIPGEVERIFDVAHNPDAALVLAENLRAYPALGRTFAVVGMFRDKDAEAVTQALAEHVDHWFLGGLEGPRGQSAGALAERVHTASPAAAISQHATVAAAFAAADAEAKRGDRLLVFGSFQTVAGILKLYSAPAT